LIWDSTHFTYYQDNYFINKGVLYEWVDMFVVDEPLIAGRPTFTCPIDNIGLQIIEDIVFRNENTVASSEFGNLLSTALDEQLCNTIERRNFHDSTH
jgi:hypothetical protein